APAILEAAARFAFEIYDGDVVLDDEHLPKMKITVMTDFYRVDGFRKQFAQSQGKRVSVGQECIDQLAIILRPVRSATCQATDGALGTLQDAFRPVPNIAGRNRFRSERGDIIAACKRELQLGDPPPDVVHPPQIGDLLIAVAGGFGRQEALFLDETVEIGA